ncbi:MAG: M48 family metallopeptidase [Dehalococcoidia bacterium]|nr:M48 family metallopeptidase [Dehalococcoidia bacterium]
MVASVSSEVALKERVEYWSGRLSVPKPRVRIREMTRKWGSCSTAGTITLAAELAHREPGFQDFVIAHELLHLRLPNHGKLFKALMTAHVPDWREYDVAK